MPPLVMTGLDPAIHRLTDKGFFLMDARVKPAHDGVIRSEKIYAGASRNAFAKASRSDIATSETAQYVTPPSVQVTMW
jgi:hypothetical protein